LGNKHYSPYGEEGKQCRAIILKILLFWLHKIINTTLQGSKLTKNSSHNFATGYQNIKLFSHNLATFSRRIFTLDFPVSGLAKQNMSPQFLCEKKPLKMVNDQKNAIIVPVFNTMFERSNIFRLKENSRQETKQFCYFFLYFIIVAANW